MPQVFNDRVIIPAQLNRGIPADANYAVVGCVELSTPGKALGWSDAAMFNLTRILELTLFGGQDPQTGEQLGLETSSLDRMDSFADLEASYDQQLAHFVVWFRVQHGGSYPRRSLPHLACPWSSPLWAC
jgi:formate C-acetyltransferase